MHRDCFVCLNTTNNKVCTICQCYAHYHCWGKYLKNYTNVITYIYEEEILITVPLYAKCPQCSGDIANVKSVTRSDTRFGRQTCQYMFCFRKLVLILSTIILLDVCHTFLFRKRKIQYVKHNIIRYKLF